VHPEVKISELFPEAGGEGIPADFLIVIVPVPAIITVLVVSVIPVGVPVMIVGLPLIVITVGIITVGIGRPYGNYNLGFGFRRNQSEKSRGDEEH
jgi:hypothetical protein